MAELADNEPETYQIMRTIERSLIEGEDVDMEQYILFWRHVCKVMGTWGTIFSFVVNDVTAKVDKLAQMLQNDPNTYGTIVSMATKEDENGTIRNPKPNRSGMGHLMVLNRALEFVIEMLDGVFTAEDPSTRVSTVARASYSKHLAPFHAWTIRGLVNTALYSLPRKTEFLIRLRGEMPETDDEQFHNVFQRDGKDIVRRVHQLVDQFNLKDYNPSA